MENSFINVINVCDIAKLINELDISFIKQSLGKDAQLFVDDFKKALVYFNDPMKDKLSAQYSPVLLFDKHLDDLIKATQNIYSILTDEGKELIQKHIQLKNNEINSLVIN